MSQILARGTSSGMAGIGDFETDNAVVVTPDASGTVTLTGGTTGLVLNGSANTVTLAGTLIVANGGTGAVSLTDGGILLGSGTAAVTVTAQPTNGQLLIGSTGVDPVLGTLASADGSVTFALGAGTIDLSVDVAAAGAVDGFIPDSGTSPVVPDANGDVTITGGTTGLTFVGGTNTLTQSGTLVVSNGGTGSTTFTAYSVITAGTTATGAFQNVSGVGTSGQVLTSNGAAVLPTWQDAPAGGVTWSVITAATKTMVVNEAYFANHATSVAFTLPATAAVGDTMQVVAMHASGTWSIAQNAGQTMYVGNTATTTGVGGSLTSISSGDWVEIVCRVANNDFQVTVRQGNVTIV